MWFSPILGPDEHLQVLWESDVKADIFANIAIPLKDLRSKGFYCCNYTAVLKQEKKNKLRKITIGVI